MGQTYTELDDLVKVYEYFSKHINFLYSFIKGLLERGIGQTFIN
jgi:hypothetical protein